MAVFMIRGMGGDEGEEGAEGGGICMPREFAWGCSSIASLFASRYKHQLGTDSRRPGSEAAAEAARLPLPPLPSNPPSPTPTTKEPLEKRIQPSSDQTIERASPARANQPTAAKTA